MYNTVILVLCKMSKKDKTIELRSKRWEALFGKYQKRGEIHTTDCLFSEVNYKFFAKPKLSRSVPKKMRRQYLRQNITTAYVKSSVTGYNFNEIANEVKSNMTDNISEIKVKNACSVRSENVNECTVNSIKIGFDKRVENIPESNIRECTSAGVSIQNVYNDESMDKENRISTNNNQNCLEDLIQFIEVDLNSSLKDMLIHRSECKILESLDYNYWHQCTKSEMTRLCKYITKAELKDYMRYCDSINTKLKLDDEVNKKKDLLKDLLIKRELVRDNKEMYLKYHNKVLMEWQRLTTAVPVDYMISYATYILYSIKNRKSKTSSLIEEETSRDCVQAFGRQTMNRGCITIS